MFLFFTVNITIYVMYKLNCGFVNLEYLIPDYTNKQFKTINTIYCCTCFKYDEYYIGVIPYLPCIISIKFISFSYYKKYGYLWENAIDGKLQSSCKEWNFSIIQFNKYDDIRFYDLSKIVNIYDINITKEKAYYYTGDNEYIINNISFINVNFLHFKLPHLPFLHIPDTPDTCEFRNIIPGTAVYIKEKKRVRRYIGFISYYNNDIIIVPYNYIFYDSYNISIKYEIKKLQHIFITRMDIKRYYYPIITTNIDKLQINDILIAINYNEININSVNDLYNLEINAYIKWQINYNKTLIFTIIRDMCIFDITIDSHNLITRKYIKANIKHKTDYNYLSYDLLYYMIYDNIKEIELYKYINNPNHKFSKNFISNYLIS